MVPVDTGVLESGPRDEVSAKDEADVEGGSELTTDGLVAHGLAGLVLGCHCTL
jgi:hypothetical protein